MQLNGINLKFPLNRNFACLFLRARFLSLIAILKGKIQISRGEKGWKG